MRREIKVKANFLGPTVSAQRWTWKIYNWKSGSWVTLGHSDGASWDSWKLFSFQSSGTPTDYISNKRKIRVRILSNNTFDNADLDYEAVLIKTSSGGGNNWLSTPKTFSYRIAKPFGTTENPPYDVIGLDLFDNRARVIQHLKNQGEPSLTAQIYKLPIKIT